MRTIKKKLEPNINILCSNCGRITPHFLNDCGEYKCSICQTVNKTVKIKTVEFVPDDNFIEEDKEFIWPDLNNNIYNENDITNREH